MTVVQNEIEIIEHLDFDPDVSCELCDKEAAWRYVGECGEKLIICQECHEDAIKRENAIIQWCSSCNLMWSGKFSDHWTWTKI